jgi:hypothetical protein
MPKRPACQVNSALSVIELARLPDLSLGHCYCSAYPNLCQMSPEMGCISAFSFYWLVSVPVISSENRPSQTSEVFETSEVLLASEVFMLHGAPQGAW